MSTRNDDPQAAFADAGAIASYADRTRRVVPGWADLQTMATTLGPLASRVDFHEGYVQTAPVGPFDAATCLLTMHFVPVAERLSTLQAIRARLKPGAPFVMAHMSLAFRGWVSLA